MLRRAHALFCSDGNYRAIPCPGAGGCTTTTVGSQAGVNCDIRGSKSGDACPDDLQDFVMCTATNAGLVCGGDIWRKRDCPGGCTNGVGGVGSPESVGECAQEAPQ